MRALVGLLGRELLGIDPRCWICRKRTPQAA